MEVHIVSLRKPAGLIAIALVFAVSIAVPIIKAQETAPNASSGLQISPTRTDISGQPGEQKNLSVTLKNITQTDVVAQVFLNDFESDNNTGNPRILIDEKDRTPYSLSKFLKNFNDLELKAGETKEVKLVVDIPANSAPGAYFGALRYAAVPKDQARAQDQRQVALTASVAHLIFVEIPGNINEQIQVGSLKAQKDDKQGSFFFSKPDKAALGVSNKGNGFSRPFGKVTVSNPFGKEVHTYDVNSTDPRGIILPNSTRTFVNELKGVNMPGKYNLTAGVAYGNGGEVITYKSSFIYMPIWAIVALLVLILATAGAVYYVYRKKFSASATSKKKRR